MSIENEIAGLTQSTTDLLEAVNTKKATLDTAVSNAQTAVVDATSQVSLAAAEKVGAQTARDTAETFKDQAYTYSQSAASAVAYQDLTAIAETKAETARDVFVYDTSKDSDGGAWRKRTQGTSWYNETLNTATRGSRKEFPAVAVIVAEAAEITIYDGDDPSMPMWMVIDSSRKWFWDANRQSVVALNGVISVGVKSADSAYSGNGLYLLNFISDKGKASTKFFTPSVSPCVFDLSTGILDLDTLAYRPFTLVNYVINDVAMTVLPDAPIDPATGLPIPTIAVATDGGVSVIKDDGTVVDYTYTSSDTVCRVVEFTKQYGLIYGLRSAAGDANVYIIGYDEIASSDVSTAPDFQFTSATAGGAGSQNPTIRYNGTSSRISSLVEGDIDYIGTADGGVCFVDRSELDSVSSKNYLFAQAESNYNTGWMNGDIKLATLSDTDDIDLVGSELIPSDFSAWFTDTPSDSTITESSGVITITVNTTGEGYPRVSAPISCVIGETYVVSVSYSNSTTGFWARLHDGISLGGKDIFVNNAASSGTRTFTFKATSATHYLNIFAEQHNAGSVDVDISAQSVRLAEADRSVNNNGLQVFGTVTREPVATGADLVAYSGFSSGSYLQQPYNSDLDFGTGDFCVMGWVKNAAGTDGRIISRDDGGGESRLCVDLTAGYYRGFVSNSDGSAKLLTSSYAANGNWDHVCFMRSSGFMYIYVNGISVATPLANADDINNSDASLYVGVSGTTGTPLFAGSLALWRISATAPTAEQIAKIYRDEKVLFQEGAQATLYGTSDAVTALAYDTDTELLHVGSSAGRSVFQGLQRVDNTTDAVGTAISASNNLVVEE